MSRLSSPSHRLNFDMNSKPPTGLMSSSMGVSNSGGGGDGSSSNKNSGAYFDRISKLSSRLQGIQVGLQSERNSRFDQLCQNLTKLDERLQISQESSQKKFGILKDQMGEFGKDLEGEKIAREKFQIAKNQDLEQVF